MTTNPYESKKLNTSTDGIVQKEARWHHNLAGLFVLLTLMPAGYVIHYLWLMFREITGDRSVEGYTNVPAFLYSVIACFATSIAFTCCTAAAEYAWGPKAAPAYQFTKLAAILSPWPLFIGYLGFCFVLASTGASWGS